MIPFRHPTSWDVPVAVVNPSWHDCYPNPVSAATWGEVKSLYD